MRWTPERRDEAFKLWDEGQSASQIAGVLGGVTRNAVIGVINRSGRQRSPEARRAAAKVNRPPKPQRRPAPAKIRPVVKVIGNTQTFAQAEARPPRTEVDARKFLPLDGTPPVAFGSRGCKWPVGGDGADLLCCGRARDGSQPYCAEHSAAAFRPLTPEQRRLARSLRRYIS